MDEMHAQQIVKFKKCENLDNFTEVYGKISYISFVPDLTPMKVSELSLYHRNNMNFMLIKYTTIKSFHEKSEDDTDRDSRVLVTSADSLIYNIEKEHLKLMDDNGDDITLETILSLNTT